MFLQPAGLCVVLLGPRSSPTIQRLHTALGTNEARTRILLYTDQPVKIPQVQVKHEAEKQSLYKLLRYSCRNSSR